MIINSNKLDVNLDSWKRINMRSVEHLLGVEFIHDLYDRYEPTINSIRFRNTLTFWKDGLVNSYAPKSEWDALGEIVGNRYYNLDESIIEHTQKIYKRKRKEYSLFLKRIKKVNFSKINNHELCSLLIDFQSIILGDLYVLNFVQVEHGLNNAIQKILKEDLHVKDNEIDSVLSNLIKTDIPTESQREIFLLYVKAKIFRLLSKLGFKNEKLKQRCIKNHYKKYRFLYSAYGEEPRKFDVFLRKFEEYLTGENKDIKFKIFPKLINTESEKVLDSLNNKKLNKLIPLLVKGGIFRDKNKSLLGLSLEYRFLILDEISKRGELRENLNYYLLSEIIDFLTTNKKLPLEIINSRKNDGVVFQRKESFEVYNLKSSYISEEKDKDSTLNLKGHCASPGQCSGKCKIVLSKEDCFKVENGDIMVAIGTDFDLIDAMYRSSAVITEESGILSHAAVVCRELKKPCCIGVKEATKILKDGQYIKLDASNGIIERVTF